LIDGLARAIAQLEAQPSLAVGWFTFAFGLTMRKQKM